MSFHDRLAAANAARHARALVRRSVFSFTGYRRGNSAVHRHSVYAGEQETRAWRQHNVFSAADRRARMQAIQHWNYREKQPGDCWGPMGPSGERFLDSLMGLRCFRTGRLDISIKGIAKKLRMSVQTVVSYIKRLEELGLLVKLRRSRPVEDPVPGGPQVEQITNAYWFILPAEIAEHVRKILEKGGVPVDHEDRERAQAALVKRMLDGLSAEEIARYLAGDSTPLAEALASFARAVDQRGENEGDSNRSNVTRSTIDLKEWPSPS